MQVELRAFAGVPGGEQLRLSGVVDIPNSCATVYIPTAIFDFPIAPSASGPHRIDPGIGAPRASA